MKTIVKVVFEPHSSTISKVTATYSDGTEDITYLDNHSTKLFLCQALQVGSMGVNIWV